jgi:hypothetical protein
MNSFPSGNRTANEVCPRADWRADLEASRDLSLGENQGKDLRTVPERMKAATQSAAARRGVAKGYELLPRFGRWPRQPCDEPCQVYESSTPDKVVPFVSGCVLLSPDGGATRKNPAAKRSHETAVREVRNKLSPEVPLASGRFRFREGAPSVPAVLPPCTVRKLDYSEYR